MTITYSIKIERDPEVSFYLDKAITSQQIIILPFFNTLKDSYSLNYVKEFLSSDNTNFLEKAETEARILIMDRPFFNKRGPVKELADNFVNDLFYKNKELNRALYWLLKGEKNHENISYLLNDIDKKELVLAAMEVDGAVALNINESHKLPDVIDKELKRLMTEASLINPNLRVNYLLNEAHSLKNFIDSSNYKNNVYKKSGKINSSELKSSLGKKFCDSYGSFYRLFWQLAYDLLIPRKPLVFTSDNSVINDYSIFFNT